MWKARIKGRQIALFAAVFVLLLALGYTAAPSVLSRRAEIAQSTGNTADAQKYYDALVRFFPRTEHGARALYFSAQMDAQRSGGFVYIMPESTWTRGGSGGIEGLEEAIAKFETLRRNAPHTTWATHALREIGQAYYELGDFASAASYFEQAIKETDMQDVQSTVLLAEIRLSTGEPGAALELVEASLQRWPEFNPLEMLSLKGRALMALGQFERARHTFSEMVSFAQELYAEMLQSRGEEIVRVNVQHYEQLAATFVSQVDRLERSRGEAGAVRGTVTLGGSGLEGVRVYLIDRATDDVLFGGRPEAHRWVITAHDGSFEFSDVAPGRYALGVMVDVSRVTAHTFVPWAEDIQVTAGTFSESQLRFVPTMSLKSPLGAESFGEEVLFSWDEVPGAAAYTLMVGPVERAPDGSIMTSYFRELRSGIRLNTLRMGVAEEVQRTLFGRFIAYEGGRVKPESILGEFFLGGEFAWGVRAFDSEGRQIADSFGYNLLSEARQLPLFRIEPQPMSRADELLLSGRFDEAIERYMQGAQLRDAHCLLVLARLFEFGVEPGLAQPERAAAYYEQLLELGDDPRVRAALADIYFSLGRFADANAMYEALVGTPVENWHTHYQLARLKLIDGEPLSALRLFDKALSVEHVQYAYTVPIALALLAEDMQSACLMAERVAAARNHVLLIHEYLDLNIRMHPEAKAAFWRGEYGASLEMLGDGDHDQFFRALVLLATENPTASQEIQVILRNLKQEVLSALLAVLSS